MADRKIVQNKQGPVPKPQSNGSLISWLVVAVVLIVFLYQLFDIAAASA